MLNTNVSNNSKVEISAVSGTITKTHKKSYMRRVHINSDAADRIFKKNSEVVVLQAMNTHEGYLLLEVVDKDVYEEE